MAEILLPVGRMIGGSLYKAQPKLDNFGKPQLDASGAPKIGYNFGVAIPKAGEQHWAQTAWGAQIRAVGAAAYPGICDTPSFAWKIIDGDSTVPNKKNRRPCDQEGYAGHWVLWFSQSWAPSICSADGKQQLTEPDAVVPGYFVQVFASVKGNAPSPTPGVYLNPVAVALAGYGQRIETSVDTSSVGFGTGPTPAGMMTTPPAAASFTPPPVGAPGMPPVPGPVAPPAGGVIPSPSMPAYTPPPVAAPAPVAPVAPVAPAPGFLNPPPAPTGPVMLPAAQYTYEQYRAGGWTDEQLRAQGLMQ